MLNKEELELLDEIQRRKIYEDKFFEKRHETKWFDELKKRGYFEPIPDTAPQESKDKGYFSIPQWNVLTYLERVSQQVGTKENEEYIDKLLEIIKAISNHKDSKGEHIDNYRTWWYFIKILCNIPNDKIPDDIIELIPIWLDSKFDTTLQGSEIVKNLLPKFLNDDSLPEDIKKAECVIDYITAYKQIPLSEERKNIFHKEYENKLVVKEYYLKDFFSEYSERIGMECGKKVIDDLASKIKHLLKQEESITNIDEISNEHYILKLKRINSEYIILVLEIKDESKTSISEKILNNETIVMNNIRQIKINVCDKDDFVNDIFGKLTNLDLFKDKIDTEILKRKVENLYRGLYSEGIYQSFYGETGYPSSDPLEMLTYFLKRILVSKTKNYSKETRNILQYFITDEYLYFRKMALYIIGININNYQDLFWEMLGKDKDDYLFDNHCYGDELKHLLNSLRDLPPEQIDKLKKRIEEGPTHFISSKDSQRLLWKQKFYGALQHTNDIFKDKYDEIKKETKTDTELISAIGKVEVRSGWGQSPLSKEDVFGKSNEELASIFQTFKTKDSWNGPTVESLAETIKEVAKEKPDKFIDNLEPFINTDYRYICNIICGIKDDWNAKKEIDWNKLLDFIFKYINRDEFWENKFKIKEDTGRPADYGWVTSMIGELIKDSVRDDSWTISDRNDLNKAKEIIFLIINKQEKPKEIYKDYMMSALNTPYGKVTEALIQLTFRIVKVEEREKDIVKWKDEDGTRQALEKLFEEGIIESYTWFGAYLIRFIWLDKDWTQQKVKEINPENKPTEWEAFMSGYLSSNYTYANSYNLIKETGNYDKALLHGSINERILRRLMEHIGIGYLNYQENLEDENSLIRKTLNKWDVKQIKELIGFLWMERDYLVETIQEKKKIESNKEIEEKKEKIINFWRWIHNNKYRDKKDFTKEDKEILSDLSKLTVFLPQIDSKNFDWLKQVAPYVHIDFTSSFFIEYLDMLKDKGETIKYIGEIFLEMLKYYTPDYKQEDIYSIVKYLYDSKVPKYKKQADEICNIYGSRGYEFLRSVYEEHSQRGNNG